MKTSRRFLSLAALWVAFLPAPLLAGPPSGWHDVDPGFRAEVLVGRDGAMWAAGSGESIAVSTDAGAHWVAKHHNPDGALLLTLHFVDRKFGYAAGTDGAVLFTVDGGESWTAQKMADETILQAAFGDPQHGVVRTISALRATTDGGKSWHPIVPASDPDWLTKNPVTNAMVALDKDWITVQVEKAPNFPYAVEFLWTKDGGTTWNTSSIDGTRIYDLIVARGAIWAAGYEGSTPMSFREVDGTKWEHVPVNYEACHWPGCGGYTAQGYFAGKDFVLLTEDGREKMARFPLRNVLTNQWVRTGDQICVLSSRSIECAPLEPVDTVEMNRDMPAWEQVGFAGIGKIPKTNPQCIRCDLQTHYFAKGETAGTRDVQISLTLGTAGHVAEVQVTGSVPDDVRENIRHQVQGWMFDQYLENGDPAPANLTLHTRVMINSGISGGVVVRAAPQPARTIPAPPK